jgi:AraC family transcriptional regulator
MTDGFSLSRIRTGRQGLPTRFPPEGRMLVESRIYPRARVAFVRHTGAHAGPGILGLWRRIDTAFGRAGIQPVAPRFGVCVDDPAVTPLDRCRYDACIAVAASFEAAQGVRVTTLPGGRYDCLRFIGSETAFAAAWMDYVARWLPIHRHRHDPSRAAMEVYSATTDPGASEADVCCDLCLPTRS